MVGEEYEIWERFLKRQAILSYVCILMGMIQMENSVMWERESYKILEQARAEEIQNVN